MELKPLKLVCFGGGTGLPSLLSGLKHHPLLEISAITTMFDSGGSSGVLRDQYGILPPGDILRCLLALSDDERSARKLLLKRIEHVRITGHTGGNLLLLALEEVYGNYSDALAALSQILSVRGRVIPVALQQSSLCARYRDGSIARSEVTVDQGLQEGKEIEELFLDPLLDASNDALKVIADADLICVGPGSFYTSVLSNFEPKGIREAIQVSCAPIIYCANLLTEGPAMKGYDISDFIIRIEEVLGRPITRCIANTALPPNGIMEKYAAEKKYPIMLSSRDKSDERIIAVPLWSDPHIARHNSAALAHITTMIAGTLLL